MPYMHLRTNAEVNKEKELALKAAFGNAIALLPGKTERWLMVDVEDRARLYFAGEDRPCAMVETEVFGSCKPKDYEALTAEVCRILGDVLGIPADGVYVKYAETDKWGWNGGNF